MGIAEGKKQSKWNADIQRRLGIAKRLDYYNNLQEHYLKLAVMKAYPRTAEDILNKYELTYPLTKRIYDDISILFQESATIEQDNENLEDDFNQILLDANFNAVMQKINVLVNLTDKVGVISVWRNDRVELDIITADNCFVIQKEDDPTDIEALFYQIGILENSPSKAESVMVYVKWTNETQSIVDIDNDDGNAQNERDIVPNRFGRIPVVFFQNDININSFWFDKGNAVVDTNEVVNVEMTNYRYMVAFQTISTLVTMGINEDAVIPFGANYSLQLPFDIGDTKTPDAKYITPNPKMVEVWSFINDLIMSTAQSVGISAESYTKNNTSFNSGYQLKLSKQDIINKTRSDRQYYRKSMKELIENMLMLETQNGGKVYTNPELTIDFGEVEFDTNPKEKEELRAMQLVNGTKNEIDFLIEDNPDLTRELAIEKYKEMQAEKKLYQIGTGFEELLGGNETNESI